ncbi:hypothetical protein GCM10011390_32650 [Aureimonas endophytica]|uniref:Uncharacterized protein n=1 Tax=Aureimonas endophytica TaxID=2027858 RepID=A0A916ZRS5_9HYPH|nr:hypothetical protein [Aureimonas endophytica]GGE11069.1 hypothetical protein GCM10011390_32650 [Aureimonas endophytica]
MSDRTVIPIAARLAEHERPILAEALSRLAAALGEASGAEPECRARFYDDLTALAEAAEGAIAVVSLQPELDRLDAPWAEEERRLRAAFEALSRNGGPVLVCTLFRHVDPAAERARALLLRIRRLDLLVLDLSREFGLFVVDLDRALADIGASRLATDYRLGGEKALAHAGRALALGLATDALDPFVSVEWQDETVRRVAAFEAARVERIDFAPADLMNWSRGRRRQLAAVVTSNVQSDHAGRLIRQVLKRQIGPRDAATRLFLALRRRGFRESAGLFYSALLHLVKSTS